MSIQNTPALEDSTFSHPIFDFLNSDEPEEIRARKLTKLLLDLSRKPSMKKFSPSLRQTVDVIRDKFIGYNRQTTKNKITRCLREFHICEMADFLDETKICKKEIRAALDELIKEDKIIIGKRRRYQEPGEHYSETYRLK